MIAAPQLTEGADISSDNGTTAATVILIDDDHEFRKAIGDYLESNGVNIVAMAGVADIAARELDLSQCVIVLDMQLGDADGLDVMRRFRDVTDAPIILMTGHRKAEIDRVVGLELGADDYLIKPFSPRELLARIRVVGRRHDTLRMARDEHAVRGADKRVEPEPPRVYRFGGWKLDRRGRQMTDPSGNVVSLTKGDFNLLVAFLDAAGKTLSREYLLNATRVHEDVFDRSIDVQILRLRRRFDNGGGAAGQDGRSIIRTERGAGYVFTVPVEAD
ncbi:two component response regulator [Acetobacter nitrogenifigens DSM 23921 = NBRC 105050]|uniref:DNA-binding response regulator n=1 Tax=Acetobacter nitrogenifigens DSM 23921 = NBRC 105050 TaxID=1120919 RepID=A0A511XBL4_9PROT|nr:response regulator [Acetobacter nitrogenifigens]GBQ90504.1 two component response regulator [Acetobacter nitrogenifigens DSM 23921 = NBRC 105050]GEN60330.1 DNA-binding response regulator [Acetobacter nitrogenifigens DSM 23921 = NBRC 105050]